MPLIQPPLSLVSLVWSGRWVESLHGYKILVSITISIIYIFIYYLISNIQYLISNIYITITYHLFSVSISKALSVSVCIDVVRLRSLYASLIPALPCPGRVLWEVRYGPAFPMQL